MKSFFYTFSFFILSGLFFICSMSFSLVNHVETCSFAEQNGSIGTKRETQEKPIQTNLLSSTTVKFEPSSGERPVPIAVPVFSTEEAEELNADAFKYMVSEKEKKEPFYSLYGEESLKTISFQGTIRAVSTVPDPEENDYDNCLYALLVEIESILSNVPADTIASEVLVNTPILKDKKLLQENIFSPGNKLYCVCAEYDSMPQAIQEIQLSDDIQLLELQQYYALTIKGISAFSANGIRDYAKRERTILPIQSLPMDEEADRLRSERIQSEILRIEEELSRHGGSFEAWKKEYEPLAEKYNRLADEKYSCWMNDCYFAAGGRTDGNESSYDTKAYIESILPYKNYLKNNNIDLIVLRIPTRGDFAARVLASDDFQENPAWVEHYYECLKNDIEIVDPMPEMWKHRFDFPLFYYFMSEDFHPFEGTYYYSAAALSEVLKRYQYTKSDQKFELQRVKTTGTDQRFLYPSGNARYSSNIEYNHVVFGEKVLDDLKADSGSPFVFLSNSFFGKYLIKDLGVPFYCAYQLQTIPDWFYQESIGPSMLYNLVSSPTLLSNRKAVIMLGCSQRNLWGKIHDLPKYILDGAGSISLEKTISLDSPDLSIIDKDSLSFSQNKIGGTTILADKKGVFSFLLSIPLVDGKKNCMIRINFIRSSRCTFALYDTDMNTVIESGIQIAKGSNTHQDLFVPMSDTSRNIRIDFHTPNPQTIKNIELWYY